jgi:hypothetical protein
MRLALRERLAGKLRSSTSIHYAFTSRTLPASVLAFWSDGRQLYGRCYSGYSLIMSWEDIINPPDELGSEGTFPWDILYVRKRVVWYAIVYLGQRETSKFRDVPRCRLETARIENERQGRDTFAGHKLRSPLFSLHRLLTYSFLQSCASRCGSSRCGSSRCGSDSTKRSAARSGGI